MEIDATAQDTVSILRVTGYLDTRASTDFERKMLELIQGGARLLAIDFTRLDMITSAGIRVLMMVVKRLAAEDETEMLVDEQLFVVGAAPAQLPCHCLQDFGPFTVRLPARSCRRKSGKAAHCRLQCALSV